MLAEKEVKTWSWVGSVSNGYANHYTGGRISVQKSWDHEGYYYIMCNQNKGDESYLGMDAGGINKYMAFFGTRGYMNEDNYDWNYYNLRLVNVDV